MTRTGSPLQTKTSDLIVPRPADFGSISELTPPPKFAFNGDTSSLRGELDIGDFETGINFKLIPEAAALSLANVSKAGCCPYVFCASSVPSWTLEVLLTQTGR